VKKGDRVRGSERQFPQRKEKNKQSKKPTSNDRKGGPTRFLAGKETGLHRKKKPKGGKLCLHSKEKKKRKSVKEERF